MDKILKIKLAGIALGTALGLTLGGIYHELSPKTIPRTAQVQQGYIASSRLEIDCKDLDGNGESETIMKIGD